MTLEQSFNNAMKPEESVESAVKPNQNEGSPATSPMVRRPTSASENQQPVSPTSRGSVSPTLGQQVFSMERASSQNTDTTAGENSVDDRYSDISPTTSPHSSIQHGLRKHHNVLRSNHAPVHCPVPHSQLLAHEMASTTANGRGPTSSEHIQCLIDVEPEDETIWRALREAKLVLARTRRKATVYPLQIPHRVPELEIGTEIAKIFASCAGENNAVQRNGIITAKAWLRTATWWVLKSRNIVNKQTQRAPHESALSSGNPHMSLHQAYADLLKATWMVYDVILGDERLCSSVTDENRKLFYNLVEATIDDHNGFRSSREAGSYEIIPGRQNLRIWEQLQPMEEAFETQDIDLNPSLDPGRWITCDIKDAGAEDERVLFRAFVNAAIGVRALRVRSRGAPYICVLWTKGGESEPKITLCNQSGSLNLCRDVTLNDIVPLSGISGNTPQPLDLSFPGMPVSIEFLTIGDVHLFMSIAKRFFDGVRGREPQAHETLTFRCVVDTFEQLDPGNSNSLVPKEEFDSCELRMYEKAESEGWNSTRRLVISSSANDPNPWSMSNFLPLSRVQLSCDEGRFVKVKWSNCCQRIQDTGGTKVPKISYVYNQHEPNMCLRFSFLSVSEAEQFQSSILYLAVPPKYKWKSDFEERHIYRMPNNKFRTLLLVNRRSKWVYSDLYHVPRDIDQSIADHRETDPYHERGLQDNGLSVQLHSIFYTDYISNHVDRINDLDMSLNPPEFSHCINKIGQVAIDFECIIDAQGLLKVLTENWQLRSVRSKVRVSYKPLSTSTSSYMFPLIGKKSNPERKSLAEISVWERSCSASSLTSPAERRLLVRWDGAGIQHRWMTASLNSVSGASTLSLASASKDMEFSPWRNSEKALIPVRDILRGTRVDIVDMSAVVSGSKEKPKEIQRGILTELTVEFTSAMNKEEFMKEAGFFNCRDPNGRAS